MAIMTGVFGALLFRKFTYYKYCVYPSYGVWVVQFGKDIVKCLSAVNSSKRKQDHDS